MGINKAFISGNLTNDCQLRSTAAGSNILTFTVAVNDRRRNPQTGEYEDFPNFIDCVIFGQRAQTLSNFLAKGSKVSIEGKLRWSQWQDKQTQKNRSKIEVIVDDIEFMSRKGDSQGQNQPQQQQTNNYPNQYQNAANTAPQQPTGYYSQPQAPNADVYASDDIPFRKAVAR